MGKRSCWDVNIKCPELLTCVGRDGGVEDAEKFTLTLYRKQEAKGVNAARHQLFLKGKVQLEKLPPTRDALELHFLRSNY